MNVSFTRHEVRGVACPKCGAGVGKPCREGRRPRQANHRERHTLYSRMQDPLERRILEEGVGELVRVGRPA